jgi:hypothetical protein
VYEIGAEQAEALTAAPVAVAALMGEVMCVLTGAHPTRSPGVIMTSFRVMVPTTKGGANISSNHDYFVWVSPARVTSTEHCAR